MVSDVRPMSSRNVDEPKAFDMKSSRNTVDAPSLPLSVAWSEQMEYNSGLPYHEQIQRLVTSRVTASSSHFAAGVAAVATSFVETPIMDGGRA